MSKPNKHIDDLFQGLKDFEEQPSLKVWDGIEKELDQLPSPKNKNRFWGFRWSILIVVLLFCLGFYTMQNWKNDEVFSENHKSLLNKPTNLDKNTIVGNKNVMATSENSNRTIEKDNFYRNSSNNNSTNTPIEKKSTSTSPQPILFDSLSTLIQLTRTLAYQKVQTNPSFNESFEAMTQLMPLASLKSIQKSTPQVSIQTQTMNPKLRFFRPRWNLGVSYSKEIAYRYKVNETIEVPYKPKPIYTALSNTDTVDKEIPILSNSFSLSAFYNVNKHWAIGVGIAYETKGLKVLFYNANEENSNDTLLTFSGFDTTSTLTFQNDIPMFYAASSFGNYYFSAQDSTVELINMTHKLNYISIPFMVKYRFININRISFHALIGGSVDYLTAIKTDIVYKDENGQEKRVNALPDDTIKRLNLGAIVKLGIAYQLTPHIQFGLEPSFKMQLTPINKTTYPYSLGLHCGLSYHF